MIILKRTTIMIMLATLLLIASAILLYNASALREYCFSLAILIVGCSIMVMVFIEDVLRTIFEENATIVELALPKEDSSEEDDKEEGSKN